MSDNVLRLFDEVQAMHKARDDLIRELRQLRFMQAQPQLPAAVRGLLQEVIRTPIAYEQVRRVVGILTVHPPRFEVVPNGSSESVEATADRVEAWLNAIWPQLERKAQLPIFQRLVDHAVADGIGVLKLVYEPWRDLPLPDEEEDPDSYAARYEAALRRQPLPFAIQVVDPLMYYPLRGSMGAIEAVFEHGHVMAAVAVKALGPRVHRYLSGAGLSRRLAYLEYWDAKERRIYLERKLVHQEEHGLAFIPYFEAGGEVTSASDSARASASYLFPMRYLVPALDMVLNIKAIWGLIRALPPFVRTGPPALPTPGAGGESGGGSTVMRLAEIYEGVVGDIKPVEVPDVGKDLDQTISLIMGMIDRAGLSPVMAGIAPGARTPGYALSELRQAATSRLQGVVQNVSNCLSQVMGSILWLVKERVQERVYIYGPASGETPRREWLSISPKDVEAVADVLAHIVWRLPTDDIAMGQHAAGLYRTGLLSWETAAKQAGVENIEEERIRILKERLYSLPPVQEALIQRALSASRTGEELRAAEVAQQVMQEMEAAMGGAPGTYTGGPGPGPQNIIRRNQPTMPGVGMEIGTPNRPGASPEAQALPRFAVRRGRAAGAERRPGGRKPPPTPFGGGAQ
jgi:hypothetical protein